VKLGTINLLISHLINFRLQCVGELMLLVLKW